MHLESDQNDLLREILALLQAILAFLKRNDVVKLGGKISKPVRQQEDEVAVMGNVKSLGQTALTQNMFDDQEATITLAPTNSQGVAESFASGSSATYAAVPGTAVTLQPGAQGLTCLVLGVKGVAGTEVVTATYTNPDGTVAAPSTFTFVQTIDPTENDVAELGGSISTPVAQ